MLPAINDNLHTAHVCVYNAVQYMLCCCSHFIFSTNQLKYIYKSNQIKFIYKTQIANSMSILQNYRGQLWA